MNKRKIHGINRKPRQKIIYHFTFNKIRMSSTSRRSYSFCVENKRIHNV